jgi:hypothetical protein
VREESNKVHEIAASLGCTAQHSLIYIFSFIFIERGTTAPFSGRAHGQGKARESMHANFLLIWLIENYMLGAWLHNFEINSNQRRCKCAVQKATSTRGKIEQ